MKSVLEGNSTISAISEIKTKSITNKKINASVLFLKLRVDRPYKGLKTFLNHVLLMRAKLFFHTRTPHTNIFFTKTASHVSIGIPLIPNSQFAILNSLTEEYYGMQLSKEHQQFFRILTFH